MKSLRVALFDSEQADREAVASVLAEDAESEIVAQGSEGPAALSAIRTLRPDLAFLDVGLAGIGGFEIAESVTSAERPAIIFIADGPEHASRAFDVSAIDYLVRPVRAWRLRQALMRAKSWIRTSDMDDLEARLWRLVHYSGGEARSSAPMAGAWPSRISLKVDGDYHIVGIRDIIWAEAQRDSVKVCVSGQVRLVRESLQQFEKRLDPSRFSRIHRSFVVNLEHVVRVSAGRGGESTLWMSDGTKVPASRSNRPNLAALTSAPKQILEFARAFKINQQDNPNRPP